MKRTLRLLPSTLQGVFKSLSARTLDEMRAAIDAFIEDYKEEKEPIPEDDVTITTLKVAV